MQRRAAAWRRKGEKVVFVPTMGALHEGHLSLVRLARKKGTRVVMSIYVNPTQFGPREDFSRYPRPFARDARLAREAGVDLLFAPARLYAPDASTVVNETFFSRGRCGASRPGHFQGVATVVAKLFNLVLPDAAIFGQKDAQQCDVIERMVRDLDFPVKIVRAPIKRDKRGVAMSSRNAYLSPDEYERAVRFAALLKRESGGPARGAAKACARLKRALSREPGIELDYVEAAGGRICAAVRVGKTRLIDNVPLKQ
jgi:pantoate--beta-alanine ligase